MPTARIGTIDIAYEEHGEGPPMLAIMGLTASRYHWQEFPQRFSDKHRVISFDNRGVGESSAPRGPYTCAQMADDAVGLLDHLGIDQAIIFGCSMGGMIAQELVLRAPTRVSKLILGCTHFGGRNAIPSLPEVSDAFAALGRPPPEDALRRLLRANFSKAYADAHPDLIDTMMAHGLSHRMTPLGFQGQFMAVATHDVADRVASVKVPTLIITGNEDALVPHGNSELLAKELPHAKLVILPGVGHMFWIESADDSEKAIRDFLGD